MDETKTETTHHQGGRIQPRRSSRSALSGSPTTKEDRNGTLQETNSPSVPTPPPPPPPSNNPDTPPSTSSTTTLSTNHHSRVTRSLSADSNSNEESSNSNPNTSNTTLNGKRRRNTNNSKQSNKKKSSNSSASSPSTNAKSPPRGSGDDFERETRNTTQRLSKEAKDARKAEREIIVKKKLSELEALERTVKDQSHEEYQKLLEELQSKRSKKLSVAQGRHALMESNFKNGFLAQKKSAFDKFYVRKKMTHDIHHLCITFTPPFFFFFSWTNWH
ncbi:uncharacterized protein BX664DRAFT_333623 [Halteromyces radiatus]|uniref:uncharacterized protein n=1 Tax=Halteromyces radiatus TaxID=101107 RepID=UPI00221EF46E|nr:uncharacterized protein BX664DRAFT_333623 [Halteromyces radiatus]KAI8089675.1 hypothetical protein BX664DRAFT_333623 [Halteromyces radiatus]